MTALTEILHRHDARSPAAIAGTVIAALATWRNRAVQRRALATLSSEALRDLGISRVEAMIEADKPFWVA